jgi:hypothetical protein
LPTSSAAIEILKRDINIATAFCTNSKSLWAEIIKNNTYFCAHLFDKRVQICPLHSDKDQINELYSVLFLKVQNSPSFFIKLLI